MSFELEALEEIAEASEVQQPESDFEQYDGNEQGDLADDLLDGLADKSEDIGQKGEPEQQAHEVPEIPDSESSGFDDGGSSILNDLLDSLKNDHETTGEQSNEKEKPESEKTPIQNKIDGLNRENEVENELQEKYPEAEGYSIISEAYLRDKDGNIVKDPETGEARRIDFVVVKDGKVVDAVEVTSETADKTSQTAKEQRIREAGGNYIDDRNGNLCEYPCDIETRIERRK